MNPQVIYIETLSPKLEAAPLGRNIQATCQLFRVVPAKTASPKLDQFKTLLPNDPKQPTICSLALLRILFDTLDKLISFQGAARSYLADNESDIEGARTVINLVKDFSKLESKLKDQLQLSLKIIGNILLGNEATQELAEKFRDIISHKLIAHLTNHERIIRDVLPCLYIAK